MRAVDMVEANRLCEDALLGDNECAEDPGGPLAHAPGEDQLLGVGSAEIGMLRD